MNDQKTLSLLIGKDFELDEGADEAVIRAKMIHAFNYLLDNDVSGMMNILYRADVNEDLLKKLLISNTELPSAEVIADTYINRLKQKVETRKKYSI